MYVSGQATGGSASHDSRLKWRDQTRRHAAFHKRKFGIVQEALGKKLGGTLGVPGTPAILDIK